jgi:hypothetical protein
MSMTHDLQVSPETFAATLSGARQFEADKWHNIGLRDLACLREFRHNSYSGRMLTARVVNVEQTGEQQVTVSISDPLLDE